MDRLTNRFVLTALLLIMAVSCNSNQQNLTAGISLANMDTNAAPGTDFYQYANGGWIKNNPLTGEYSRFGSFDKLAEDNRLQLKSLIEELASTTHEAGSVAQKIGDLYNIAMDSTKLNNEGVAPLLPELQKVETSFTDNKSAYLPDLMLKGCSLFFNAYVTVDMMNSNQYIFEFSQGGLSIGERDYYVGEDENSRKIRDAFQVHVAKMFQLCGFDSQTATKNAAEVLRIETRLAQAHYDKVKNRDPYAIYHKMSVEELAKIVPSLDWKVVFSTLGVQPQEVNVSQPEALEVAGKVIADEPLSSLVAYIQWNLINSAATLLDDKCYAQNFDFYEKTMSGIQEQRPRWKRAQSTVSSWLGEAVGQMYVEKYFPPQAKERITELVHNLQSAYAERIQSLTWMGDSTKLKAIDKLNAFYIKVGYPNKWKDYSTLEIKNDSYLANAMRVSEFMSRETLNKLGKPVDKDEWFMTPQTVNAYYNPTSNEICFPAGILQPPFFDVNADDAFNYGAIGVVIGHEMTHGFDDQGRQFDKEGNLANWWTEEDATQFNTRAKVMSDFFDSIEVAPGVHANGAYTLGETLADYGGLQIAYLAFKNATANAPLEDKDGLTADQRFFLAYSGVWASNIRDEEILRLTKIDPHALGKWRVNGELPHIGAWYDAFGITEKDPMYIPQQERVSIW